MKKKLLSLLLACLTGISAYAYAFQVDGIFYNYTVGGTDASVTSGEWRDYSGTVVIPESVTFDNVTYTVTSIGSYAFFECTDLTSVTIPSSVTSISGYAFYGCSGLTSVTIPDSVTSIGEKAFYDCAALPSVSIPGSVISIGNAAFSGCSSLTSVTIENNNPANISLGTDVFAGVSTNTCAFVVPKGSMELYAATEQWGNFNIAEASQTLTGLNYEFTDDTHTAYKVSGFTSDLPAEVSIPPTHNGLPVVSIGAQAFSHCSNLTSMSIPESVTSICDEAFSWCTALTAVTIPGSVTSIGNSAFANCTGLTSVDIQEAATSIGEYAFYNCKNLVSVTIPDCVTSIGGSAFYGTALYEDASNWVDNVLYIDNHLIKAKEELAGEYFVKEETVTIAYAAFSNCHKLTSVTIPNSITAIKEYVFSGCTRLTSVAIPEGVTSIGDRAFLMCFCLTSVTLPESIVSIGEGAFTGCNSLTSFYGKCASADNRCLILDGTLKSFAPAGLSSYTIPESVTSIGEMAFTECNNITSVLIPKTVTTINNGAFRMCCSLSSVTIPESVTSIGEMAFMECNNLSSVIIYNPDPANINVGEDAFGLHFMEPENTCALYVPMGSKSLYEVADSWREFNIEEVTLTGLNYEFTDDTHAAYKVSGFTSDLPAEVSIPPTHNGLPVTGIAEHAFQGCSTLTSVVIPETVTAIGGAAFYNCSYLTTATIPESVTSLGWSAFFDCLRLTSVTIPKALTSIEWGTFNGCRSLTSVTIPEGVTSIGGYAFRLCSMTEVTVPNSVTSLGDYAFYECSSLTSAAIGNAVTSIGEYAFGDCSNLTSLTIGNSVTSIGNYAFFSCKGMDTVIFPETLTSIGSSAFSWCTGLTSVIIPESVTSIGNGAFYRCSSLNSVKIPDSVTSIGNRAFYGIALYNDDSNWQDNVLYIDNHLIAAKSSLSGLYTVKDGTLTIAGGAFSSCRNLTGVTIANSVTSICEEAFYNCTGLTSMTFPLSVSSIGERVFYECTGLASVTIPASVTSLGYLAFYQCKALSSVTVRNNDPDKILMGPDVFLGVPTSTCVLYVPNGSTELYGAATQWMDFSQIQEEGASAMDDIRMDDNTDDAPYYDLMGRRVENPTPGIYIHGGKKVLVK